MAAYVTADQIAAALGVTFTPEQAAQADAVAAAVTAFVDRYTGRSWQGTSPISAEVRPVVVPGPADTYGAVARCYLAHVPVSTVDAVSLRSSDPNDPTTPLDPATYELVDPAHGVLLVPGYGYGALGWWYGRAALAVVDYAYADAVPADIELAATMIASGVMQQTLATQAGSAVIAANPQLAGLESISVGQGDIQVELASGVGKASASMASGSAWAAPGSAVASLLDGYRRVVIA